MSYIFLTKNLFRPLKFVSAATCRQLVNFPLRNAGGWQCFDMDNSCICGKAAVVANKDAKKRLVWSSERQS
jgi:hypothetical protein